MAGAILGRAELTPQNRIHFAGAESSPMRDDPCAESCQLGNSSVIRAKFGRQTAAKDAIQVLSEPRVAATSGETDMSQTLPRRARSYGTYAAVALFVVVYLGVLGVVLAPRDTIAVQSGAVFMDE